MIFLRLADNGRELGDLHFEQGLVHIGNTQSADVPLPGLDDGLRATISATTLMLAVDGGEVCVNGQPTNSSPLENGDTITIGRYELRFFHSKPTSTVAFGDTRTWKVARPQE